MTETKFSFPDEGAFSQLVTVKKDSGVLVPPQDDPSDSKDEGIEPGFCTGHV